MDWETKLQISNIITAHQLDLISFEEASTRMKEIYNIEYENTKYKLN